MNHKLQFVKEKVEYAHTAQGIADAYMKDVFPKGKEVCFRRGNMTQAAPGEVIWARMIQGHAELRVTNMWTGKDRNIDLSDVIVA
jgi:hypothetical protein